MTSLTIHGTEFVNDDTRPLFNAAIERALRFQLTSHTDLYCNPREKTGWLEYLLVVTFANSPPPPEKPNRMTIGCIQREPGYVFEFHS